MNKILTVVLSVAILLTGMVFMSGCNEVNHKAIEIKIGSEVKEFNTIDDSVLEYLNTETEEVVKIKLHKDLELTTTCFYFTTNVYEFDLNGHDISYPTDTVGDGIFCVSGDAELTINGNGVIDAASQANDYSMAVWALENGKVTINGGTFTNVGAKDFEDADPENPGAPLTPNNNELIYARDNAVITINGGKFIGNYQNETYGGDIIRFVLNIKDKHAAQIIVKGGEYRQYNPAASLSENPQANFVADGFESTLDTRKGVDWYVVSEIAE